MKIILVLTDFSENAYHALHYIAEVLGDEALEIHILYSMEEQASNLTSRIDIGRSEDVMSNLYEQADKQGAALIERITKETNQLNHRYAFISTAMSLSRAVSRFSSDNSPELIVAGCKGKSASATVSMGTHAKRLIRKIKKTPVLIVPFETPIKQPEKIAFATAFNHHYSEDELTPLKYFLSLHPATLRILHLDDPDNLTKIQRSNMKQLISLLQENFDFSLRWKSPETSKTDGILGFAEAESSDMLAMLYYKHHFFAQLFRESVINKLISVPTIPLLVIPSDG